MSKSLNYQTLCNLYTLEQIQTKVDYYLEQLEKSAVREYKRDTTQGMIQVESEEMKNIESVLAVWMKALECKKGMGGVNIVSANFGGHV